jgi:hypothetical protein
MIGKPAIKNHRIQHHTEDCICQYCNRYLQPQNLKRHIEKEHYCDICQNHMEYQKECYHLGVKRSRNRKEFKNPQIQCKYCDEMMDKNLLKTHMNRFLQYPNFLVYIFTWTGMDELLDGHVNLIIYPNLYFLDFLILIK